MIVDLINLLLVCIAIKSYATKQYVASVVILAFFATNAFILKIGDPLIKYYDYGLLEIFICLILGLCRSKKFFTISSYPGKVIVAFLLFLLVVFLYSLVIQADSISNIISVLRFYFYIISYFILRVIPKEKLEKSVRIIFKFTILACVFFILQYITHYEFVNTYIAEGSQTYRMQITPPFMIIFTLTLLLFGAKVKYRYLYLLTMFAVFLFAQNRTPIVQIALQLLVYIIFANNFKYKFSVMILSSLAFPFFSSMFDQRAEENKVTTSHLSLSDVQTDISNGNYASLSHESTFLFRVAMIAERWNYINNHPENALLGIGAMHEMSKNNRYNFFVGTWYTTKEGTREMAQIQSNDTLWSSIILRFGYVGIFVFLFYLVLSANYFYKRRQNSISFLGFLFFLAAIVGSISSGGAFSSVNLLTHSLLFICVEKKIKIDNIVK